MFIKEGGIGGETDEEPWVVLRNNSGRIVRKLRYCDYERVARKKYPLRNPMLLHLFRFLKDGTGRQGERAVVAEPVGKPVTRREKKMMMDGYQVISMDKGRSFRPENDGAYHHFYFHLSGEIPERWARIFTRIVEERMARNPENRRFVWLEKEQIAVRCRIRDLRAAYLADIKATVREANARYRKMLEKTLRQGTEAGIDGESLNRIAEHMFGAVPH